MQLPEQTQIRVLMITARSDYGGGPEAVYRLIAALPSYIKIFVACPQEEPYWDRYSKLVGADSMIEIPHRKFSLGRLLAINGFIRDKDINLVHSHGKGAGIYSRALRLCGGPPCLHHYHGIHIGDYGVFKKRFYLLLERLLSHTTKVLIAVSNGEAEMAVALGICNPNKLRVIENGVVIPETVSVNPESKNRRFDVLTMTRFNFQKNSELLIPILEALDVIGRLDDFRFMILGGGEGEESLRSEITARGYGEAVSFGGSVVNPSDYLSRASCYISTSRWEGLPLAVLEAMAHGLPVVASDVVGNRDTMINGETGFLYDQNKPEAAALHLIYLADNKADYNRLSQRARARAVERYSVQRVANEIASIYNRECRISASQEKEIRDASREKRRRA